MRRPDRDTQRSLSRIRRRTMLLGGLQVSVLGVLGMRMRQLQIEESEKFRLLAEENRINLRLLPPARGLIYDRNGVLLAGNEPNYRVVIVREDAGDVEMVLKRLAMIVPISDDELERARREIARRSPFVPITVADRLDWEDFAEVAVNAPALPGITPEVGLSRSYPDGASIAHVVGYVGPVSDYDLSKLENPAPLLQIPKFQIGKTGAENKLERTLRGSAGTKQVEVNATGRVMRELARREGQSGADLQLTVDANLQGYVQARLGEESAAVVIIDCETGDLVERLMGKKPEKRFEYIQANARFVEELDV